MMSLHFHCLSPAMSYGWDEERGSEYPAFSLTDPFLPPCDSQRSWVPGPLVPPWVCVLCSFPRHWCPRSSEEMLLGCPGYHCDFFFLSVCFVAATAAAAVVLLCLPPALVWETTPGISICIPCLWKQCFLVIWPRLPWQARVEFPGFIQRQSTSLGFCSGPPPLWCVGRGRSTLFSMKLSQVPQWIILWCFNHRSKSWHFHLVFCSCGTWEPESDSVLPRNTIARQ